MAAMTNSPLTGIQACVFDAYGTLFDYAAAAARCKQALGADWSAFSDLWRRKQLEYTWLRSLMSKHADFWQVTAESLDFTMAAFARSGAALRAQLMQQYLSLDCYPGVAALLQRLQGAGLKTAILSNGSPSMLAAIVNTAAIGRLLDAVLSVESVGVFKPHPSVYQLAVDRLGVAPNQICFVSSNSWDAAGAAAFGFRVAWINRANAPRDNLPAVPEIEIASLDELPALLGLAA
jgi:2-haloacid dehalogenase